MIINPNKSIHQQQLKQKKQREAIQKSYMQLQYQRAELESTEVKRHNENLLKQFSKLKKD